MFCKIKNERPDTFRKQLRSQDQIPDRSRFRRTMAATSCLSVETLCSSFSEKSLSRRLCSSTNSLSPSRSESSWKQQQHLITHVLYTKKSLQKQQVCCSPDCKIHDLKIPFLSCLHTFVLLLILLQ